MDKWALHGWRGWKAYFKSFTQRGRETQIAEARDEVLLVYRDLHKLIREKCPRYAMRESKKEEFKLYFKEARTLEDPHDYFYFLNAMKFVRQRLLDGYYPPFPRRLPYIDSDFHEKDMLFYRRHIWNVNKDDIILEPGQDPLRQPFIEPRQYHSDLIERPDFIKHLEEGIQFPEESKVFDKDKN